MVKDTIAFRTYKHLDDDLFSQVMVLKESVEECEGIETGIGFDEALNFHSDMHAYVVASVGDTVVGVATIFAPQPHEGEIAVCVASGYRCRGIGKSMVSFAMAGLARFKIQDTLLLCDGKSESGRYFVASLQGEDHFHEYSMLLEDSDSLHADTSVVVRTAISSDIELMATLCAAAYEDPYDESLGFIQAAMGAVQRTGYIGELAGIAVASCFVSRNEKGISINTVAVEPSYQRKGIATAFLSNIILLLLSERKPIVLDVNSSNLRAFGLYKKLGFVITSDIGYYRIPPITD
jgi:ribosomal protein S18 acetylase RimI-like enzyme